MTTAAPQASNHPLPPLKPKTRKRWKWDRKNPSDNLDPVLVKEVRQGLRSKRFIVPFIISQLALLVAVGIEVLEIATTGQREVGHYAFWGVLSLCVITLIPLTGLWSVSSEYHGRQFELLRLSGLTRWKVISGKWQSLMLQSLLVILSSIPYLLLRYLIGGMELIEGIFAVLGMFVLSANLVALCLAVSAFRTGRGRLFSFVFLSGSLVWHISLVAGGVMFLAHQVESFLGIGLETAIYILTIVESVPAAIGSTLLLLAIASSKLRFYETIYGGDRGNSLAVLYAVSPYVIGFATLITLGIGLPIAWIFLAVSAWRVQREKDGEAELVYAAQWINRDPTKGNLWQPKTPPKKRRGTAGTKRPQATPPPLPENPDSVVTEQKQP